MMPNPPAPVWPVAAVAAAANDGGVRCRIRARYSIPTPVSASPCSAWARSWACFRYTWPWRFSFRAALPSPRPVRNSSHTPADNFSGSSLLIIFQLVYRNIML